MRLALATVVLALTLAACGGDDGGEQPAASGECPSGAVVIRMADIKFDPEDATARAGQEICWPNDDDVEHNAVAESGADCESELSGKGETFTTTVACRAISSTYVTGLNSATWASHPRSSTSGV